MRLPSILVKIAAMQSQPQHQEFLDEHFSINPAWKDFKKKLRSKSFVEAVKQDTRSDEKLKRYSEANGEHIRARGVPTFKVPSDSSNKNYTVKFHPGSERFSCNCGDWVHARSHQVGKKQQDCKHVTMLKTQLKMSGELSKLTKQAAMGLAAVSVLKALG